MLRSDSVGKLSRRTRAFFPNPNMVLVATRNGT